MINSSSLQTSPWLEVIVVDARPADFVEMAATLATYQVSFRFARSADDALRMARHQRQAVWLINVSLPDMAGSELLRLLRERDPRLSSFLVGERYRAEDELRCRASGALAYVCKPAAPAWLAPWLENSQQPAKPSRVAIGAAK